MPVVCSLVLFPLNRLCHLVNLVVSLAAGVTSECKVQIGIAVALVVVPILWVQGALGVDTMVITHVFKVVYLVSWKKQCRCDRMDGSISPSLVEKTAGFVEIIKVGTISIRSPKV